jgi:GDPmannose 4,6-dehydratase
VLAFAEVGIALSFQGQGADEVGLVESVDARLLAEATGGAAPGAERLALGTVVVRVDPRYFRPTEVAALLGDASKARNRLGWKPAVSFGELVHEMVWADLAGAQLDELCRREGFRVLGNGE